MSKNSDTHFSRWLYKIGATVLSILAVVAMIAFIKAFFATEDKEQKNNIAPTDSVQVEVLKKEVQDLNKKVDSLIILTQKEHQKKYVKPKMDNCTIEVNIHNQ